MRRGEIAAKKAAEKAAKEATIKAEKKAKKEKIETVKKMLEDNLDINNISKYTGLSISDIEKIRA